MQALFLKVLNMSLTAGYVILAVLLIRLLLRRAPRKYSYFLWSVVLFRLICPVSFASVISVFRLWPFDMTVAQREGTAALQYIPPDIGLMNRPRVTVGIPTANALIQDSLPAAVPAASVNPLQLWVAAGTAVWLAGIALLLLYSAVSLLKVYRRMDTAVLLEKNVRQSDRIRAPFVLGFIRPRVYLPFALKESERPYILAHERYHIRRRDYLVKPLFFLGLTLHWFNPLVWLAYALMSRDMEMSCDEYVLGTQGGGIAAAYSTSLLSFAANRRLATAGPLCFGEAGVKGRVSNILRWKHPKPWATAAAALICFAVIAACASNPSAGTAAKDEIPLGTYEFGELMYMNPLSSFLPLGDFKEYYTLTDDAFIITGADGGTQRFDIAPEKTQFDETAFADSFFAGMGMGEPDLSGIKEREQFNLTGSRYRLYRMDNEIWLANVHQGNKRMEQSEYFWSIYRISPYEGNLPEASAVSLAADENARLRALLLLDGIFQNGAHIGYIGKDAMLSYSPTARHFDLSDEWYAQRYRVLFDCNWEPCETLRTPGPDDICLELGDADSGFWFFLGSDEVSWLDQGKAVATWRAGSLDGTLTDAVLSEFSGYEADYRNISLAAEGYGSFEEVAQAFLEAYGSYLKDMTPENTSRITDFKVQDLEVFLTRKGDDNVFGFRTDFSVKPVNFAASPWWAGNSQAGTGDLEGYLTMYRELRLEKTNGVWRCTDMGTGGLSLEE
jgi:beta-lactamase regulating signal transducer with metallopeptidase domain